MNVLPLHLSPRGRYALALFASILSVAFCAVMTVMTALFWKEAWDNRWVSDTMWRARLWIPYSAMPIGLGLAALGRPGYINLGHGGDIADTDREQMERAAHTVLAAAYDGGVRAFDAARSYGAAAWPISVPCSDRSSNNWRSRTQTRITPSAPVDR